MARKYELKARAERQEETRRKIVEAAIELHGTVGPARTTVSDIAERAGVQRHTCYRHFPDDRSLALACSGLYTERNPMPDPEPWRAIADPKKRLRVGLGELYAFFERNEPMLTNIVRDSEVDPLTRELSELRMGPQLGPIRQTLAQALPGRGRKSMAALDLALDFGTWRLLARRAGLAPAQAGELVARMLWFV
jgi:AcrR family transcriptional regulator